MSAKFALVETHYGAQPRKGLQAGFEEAAQSCDNQPGAVISSLHSSLRAALKTLRLALITAD